MQLKVNLAIQEVNQLFHLCFTSNDKHYSVYVHLHLVISLNFRTALK